MGDVTPEQGSGEPTEPAPGARSAPAVTRPFLGPTPRSARSVTPAPAAGRVTPPYLPRELSYTPARVAAVPAAPPAPAAPSAPAPKDAAAAHPANEIAGPNAEAVRPAEPSSWPGGPNPRGREEDAWDWGGEPQAQASAESAGEWAAPVAATQGTPALTHPQDPDWFEQPLAGRGPAANMRLPEERAAEAMEALAHQLRTGALTLDGRAALDSEEAVLASVLAALFARRVR